MTVRTNLYFPKNQLKTLVVCVVFFAALFSSTGCMSSQPRSAGILQTASNSQTPVSSARPVNLICISKPTPDLLDAVSDQLVGLPASDSTLVLGDPVVLQHLRTLVPLSAMSKVAFEPFSPAAGTYRCQGLPFDLQYSMIVGDSGFVNTSSMGQVPVVSRQISVSHSPAQRGVKITIVSP